MADIFKLAAWQQAPTNGKYGLYNDLDVPYGSEEIPARDLLAEVGPVERSTWLALQRSVYLRDTSRALDEALSKVPDAIRHHVAALLDVALAEDRLGARRDWDGARRLLSSWLLTFRPQFDYKGDEAWKGFLKALTALPEPASVIEPFMDRRIDPFRIAPALLPNLNEWVLFCASRPADGSTPWKSGRFDFFTQEELAALLAQGDIVSPGEYDTSFSLYGLAEGEPTVRGFHEFDYKKHGVRAYKGFTAVDAAPQGETTSIVYGKRIGLK